MRCLSIRRRGTGSGFPEVGAIILGLLPHMLPTANLGPAVGA
jgi:hypothetical protein